VSDRWRRRPVAVEWRRRLAAGFPVRRSVRGIGRRGVAATCRAADTTSAETGRLDCKQPGCARPLAAGQNSFAFRAMTWHKPGSQSHRSQPPETSIHQRMKWYYVENGQQAGPVEEAQLAELIQNGKLRGDTLVWHEGMAAWQPFSGVCPPQFAALVGAKPIGMGAPTGEAPEAVCAECHNIFRKEDMIRHQDVYVCANCKPVFMQKLGEGMVSGTRRGRRSLPVNADALIAEIEARGYEVDIIATLGGRLVPFEVKYRSQATGLGELKGMQQFCAERQVARGYVITKEVTDFGVLPLGSAGGSATVVRIPAPLACQRPPAKPEA